MTGKAVCECTILESFEGSFTNPVFMPDRPEGVDGYETPSECHVYSTIPETLHDTLRSISHFPSGRYISDNGNEPKPDIPVPIPSSVNIPISYTKNGKPVREKCDANSVRTSVASTASTVRSTAPLASPRNSLTFGKNITKRKKIVFIFVLLFIVLSLSTALVVYFTVFYQLPQTQDNEKTTMFLYGSLRIVSGKSSVFTKDLQNPLSARYLNMSRVFCKQMDDILQSSNHAAVYNSTQIIYFTPGSVVITYQVNFKSPISQEQRKVTVDGITTKTIELIIKSEIKIEAKRALWGRYIVDPQGFTFSYDKPTSDAHSFPENVIESQSTTPSVVTNRCHPVTIPQCRTVLPYNLTSRPITDQNTTNIDLYIQRLGTCYEHVAFVLCVRVMPMCDGDTNHVLPCRRYCEAVKRNCDKALSGLESSYIFQCTDYPLDDGHCIRPPRVSSTSMSSFPPPTSIAPGSTTSSSPKCEAIALEFCQQVGWHETVFPNFMNHLRQLEAELVVELVASYCSSTSNTCSQYLHVYACAILTPKCQRTYLKLPPCRRLCEAAASSCSNTSSVPMPRPCDTYPDSSDPDVCIQPPMITASTTAMIPTCAPSMFDCGNGECRPLRDRCDGTNDCMNFADEKNCDLETSCQSDQFRCISGHCRPLLWMCDGQQDCPDGSDEKNCTITSTGESPLCKANEFQCKSGTSKWDVKKRCIPLSWKCDGNKDCTDDSDEDQSRCVTS